MPGKRGKTKLGRPVFTVKQREILADMIRRAAITGIEDGERRGGRMIAADVFGMMRHNWPLDRLTGKDIDAIGLGYLAGHHIADQRRRAELAKING